MRFALLKFYRASFVVPFAETDEERTIGMSQHTEAPEGTGMLFRVRGRDSFTMQQMKIGLDMVWMNSNGVVIRVNRNLPAGRIEPVTAPPGAKLMLEVGAGQAAGIKAGSLVQMRMS